jgi:hypothetical protein
MLAITHTLISLPFAVYLHNPILIFLAAFAWHLFADTLLHWNFYPEVFKKYFFPAAIGDALVSLVIAYLVLGNDLFTIPYLAAIAGGNMPDVLHSFWEMMGAKRQEQYFSWAKPWFHFHDSLQLETPSIVRGLIAQVILIAVALIAVR